jgi:hypothetical protein
MCIKLLSTLMVVAETEQVPAQMAVVEVVALPMGCSM